MEVKELWKPLEEYKGIETLKNIIHKKKQCERLDNQQPSNYNSIYN